ncbi:MAG: hypothetical protein ABSA53_34530 [Streptosporangiaceae bacterium]
MGLLRTLAVLWRLRQAFHLARFPATAVLVLLWPVTAAAVLPVTAAWLAGWPHLPRRRLGCPAAV